MTKTYCDRCGEETKDSNRVGVTLQNPRRDCGNVTDQKFFDWCNRCLGDFHEFQKPLRAHA